jgi:hypothetical protein
MLVFDSRVEIDNSLYIVQLNEKNEYCSIDSIANMFDR